MDDDDASASLRKFSRSEERSRGGFEGRLGIFFPSLLPSLLVPDRSLGSGVTPTLSAIGWEATTSSRFTEVFIARVCLARADVVLIGYMEEGGKGEGDLHWFVRSFWERGMIA